MRCEALAPDDHSVFSSAHVSAHLIRPFYSGRAREEATIGRVVIAYQTRDDRGRSMIWVFVRRGCEQLHVEVTFEPRVAEYVVGVRAANRRTTLHRFRDANSFNDWIRAFKRRMLDSEWSQRATLDRIPHQPAPSRNQRNDSNHERQSGGPSVAAATVDILS
jgi:hypothetical protein